MKLKLIIALFCVVVGCNAVGMKQRRRPQVPPKKTVPSVPRKKLKEVVQKGKESLQEKKSVYEIEFDTTQPLKIPTQRRLLPNLQSTFQSGPSETLVALPIIEKLENTEEDPYKNYNVFFNSNGSTTILTLDQMKKQRKRRKTTRKKTSASEVKTQDLTETVMLEREILQQKIKVLEEENKLAQTLQKKQYRTVQSQLLTDRELKNLAALKKIIEDKATKYQKQANQKQLEKFKSLIEQYKDQIQSLGLLFATAKLETAPSSKYINVSDPIFPLIFKYAKIEREILDAQAEEINAIKAKLAKEEVEKRVRVEIEKNKHSNTEITIEQIKTKLAKEKIAERARRLVKEKKSYSNAKVTEAIKKRVAINKDLETYLQKLTGPSGWSLWW